MACFFCTLRARIDRTFKDKGGTLLEDSRDHQGLRLIGNVVLIDCLSFIAGLLTTNPQSEALWRRGSICEQVSGR